LAVAGLPVAFGMVVVAAGRDDGADYRDDTKRHRNEPVRVYTEAGVTACDVVSCAGRESSPTRNR
jgi:hypothetical protein